MKTQTISALVALASSVPLATATFGWTGASKFSCPANTDNKCNSQQSSGFDWTSLDLGNFGNYGGFDFSGFSCASSFGGSTKRDYITGRTFQNKCITGKATKDISSAPSFGCGSGGDVDKFSIDHFQVSVEFDCDLEFHYDMPDGSTCKQKSSCKKSGTTVKNTQCGGAKNVSVILPSGSGGGKDSCSIGFHSIGFDCNSASSTVPPTSKPTTTSIPATTPASSEAVTTPSSSATSEGTESTPPASTSTAGVSIPPTSTPPFPTGNDTASAGTSPTETTAVTTPPTLTTSTIFETQVSTIISCAETVTNCPAHSTVLTTVIVPVSTTICPVTATETAPGTTSSAEGVTTSPVETSPAESTSAETTPATISSAEGVTSTPVSVDITTVIIQTSTTLCPVTTTHTSEGVTSVETGVSTSTVIITSTSTVCTKCTVKPTSEAPATTSSAEGITSEVATTATTSSGPVTTAPCPDVLPQCLNTWLFSSGCSDNTDADCYCPSGDFVSSVYQCLSAYGASDDDVAKAQQYFQGICAAHIPSNPAIVTGASPVATSSSAGVTAPASVPVTTIQVLTTIVVPCTETEGPSAGSVIPSSSSTVVISTALTVPQVVFSTITAGASASGGAALVPGTAPASVPAGATTPAAPAQTTFASVITSGAANRTQPATTSPVPFTGAGSQLSTTFAGALVAVVFAVFAM